MMVYVNNNETKSKLSLKFVKVMQRKLYRLFLSEFISHVSQCRLNVYTGSHVW